MEVAVANEIGANSMLFLHGGINCEANPVITLSELKDSSNERLREWIFF